MIFSGFYTPSKVHHYGGCVIAISALLMKTFLLKFGYWELLVISSLSVVTSVLASYFQTRRSELALFCYIANDLVIITLWLIPILNGQTELISVLVGPILLLINDIYGSYNWKRLKKEQKIGE